ncbi:MAG: hypothetical protein KAU44_03730 [Candidatus Marinimicrobia bacterium]|nr:hypothetical protein [Candidatus Neomarinimicrobiota bacterium]
MSITLKIIGIALFYIITIGSGIVMHKKGRPFKPLLAMAHKVITLVVVVGTILLVRTAFTEAIPSTLVIILFTVSMLLLISLFVTGALLSGEKEMPKIILVLHDISTYTAPITIGVTFFLMFKN